MYLAILLSAAALTPAAAVKVLAISGAVYGALQQAKKFIPGISGGWAIGMNVALSALGIIVATAPDQLLTVSTLLSVVTAATMAAGIHGTVQNMTPAPASVPVAPTQSTPTK